MSLIGIIRSGVKIADATTKSAQSAVTLNRCTAVDEYGTKTYTSHSLLAVLEEKERQVKSPDGVLVPCSATLVFLDVDALLAATPATSFSSAGPAPGLDRITLPNGRTAVVINTGGFIDPGTGNPAAPEVYL
jgi:hypothetical protein